MKVIDPEAWAAEVREQTENGVYGSLVTETVEAWADALEAKMASGKRLGAIALPTLMEVDDTISGGGVYECTRLLQEHWSPEYGVQLRRYLDVCNAHENETVIRFICWVKRI